MVLSMSSFLILSRTSSAQPMPACRRSPIRKRGALKYSVTVLISSTSLSGVLKAGPPRPKCFLNAWHEPPHVMQL